MRNFLISTLSGIAMLALTACNIDPAQVVTAVQQACSIAVPVATIVTMLNLDPTMSVSAITNLICSGYKGALSERKLGAAAKGSKVEFVVFVNGQPVQVEATVQ